MWQIDNLKKIGLVSIANYTWYNVLWDMRMSVAFTGEVSSSNKTDCSGITKILSSVAKHVVFFVLAY